MCIKKVLCLIILGFILFPFSTAYAEEITTINKELNKNVISKDDYNDAIINAVNSVNSKNKRVRTPLITTYPRKLDPRTTNGVTSIKEQDPYGSCWAYSAVSTCESALIKQGLADNTIDLAELPYLYKYWKSEMPDWSYESGFNFGATATQVWEYMGYGIGPALESTYGSVQDYTGDDISDDVLYSHIFDLDYIEYDGYSSPTKTNYLKRIIYDCGGATICYYSGPSKYYLSNPVSSSNDDYNNTGDSTYYNPKNINMINHAIEIVGWDDDYPKENFACEPEGNGAWLVKNSWGTKYKADFDENENEYLEEHNEEKAAPTGYYWISYYEHSLFDVAGVGVVMAPSDTKTTGIKIKDEEKYTKLVNGSEEIIIELNAGDTYDLGAEVVPATASDKTIIYESYAGSIATVDNNGKITARREGQAPIMLTNTGGIRYNDEVTNGTIIKTVYIVVTGTTEDTEEPTTTTETSTPNDEIPTETDASTDDASTETITTDENSSTKDTKTEVKTPTYTQPIIPVIKTEPTTSAINTPIVSSPSSNVKAGNIKGIKLKSTKKQIIVSFNKQAGCTYDIKIAKNKKMKKAKVYHVKGNKYTISKLSKKTKYYIQIRAIGSDSEGQYSKVKTIKTK